MVYLMICLGGCCHDKGVGESTMGALMCVDRQMSQTFFDVQELHYLYSKLGHLHDDGRLKTLMFSFSHGG